MLNLMLKRININGQELVFYVDGTGKCPVVVMHGWGCRASTVNLLAQAALTPETTVYNLDLPGFGDSPEPPETWGIEQYTECIEGFCRELGLKAPVLIGHSFGGRIAILMASRSEVSKVILVDAAGIKPSRSLGYYVKVYSFKTAKKLLPLLLGRKRGQAAIDRWRGKAGSSDYAAASPVMRRIMSTVVNQDLTDRLPLIKAPTLLIWGEKDTATPLKDAKKMERLIPGAGLVSYPEAGHYSFLDRPAQTSAVVRSFINS